MSKNMYEIHPYSWTRLEHHGSNLAGFYFTGYYIDVEYDAYAFANSLRFRIP
jgi:hypothetical protein